MLTFITVACVCEVDRSASRSRDWFPYVYDMGKLIFIEGSASMVRNLPNRGEELFEGIADIRPVHRAKFAFRWMTFEFARAASTSYFEDGNDVYELLSLEI